MFSTLCLDGSGPSVDWMDLLKTAGIKVFATGESERCLKHGLKDDVIDGKKINSFPFVCSPVGEFANAPFTIVEDLPTPLKAQ